MPSRAHPRTHSPSLLATLLSILAHASPCAAVEPATWGTSGRAYVANADDPSRVPAFFEIVAGYASSGFGVGLGARVGTTYANGLYVGGSLTYQPKESLTAAPDASSPVPRDYGASLFSAGAEVGFDAKAAVLVLRPYLGAGLGVSSSQVESRLGAAGWLGVQTIYSLAETSQFFALDVRGTLTSAQGDDLDGGVGVFLAYGIRIGSADPNGRPPPRSR